MAASADGPWRAWPARPARARAGWVGPQARPNPIEFFFFFSNLFLIPETIPEIAEIVLKARKILRKSQKFQESS
jgi:hypothetical protein